MTMRKEIEERKIQLPCSGGLQSTKPSIASSKTVTYYQQSTLPSSDFNCHVNNTNPHC